MGFEIPVDVDYFEHPKTLELMSIIGPEADIYPLRLWKWCALYAKTGFVKGGKGQIEIAVKWTGPPGKLHKALIRCGFVEPDGKTVHDFMEHIGRAILIYENKKLKQREKYAAQNLPEELRKNSPYPGNSGNSGNPSGGSLKKKCKDESAVKAMDEVMSKIRKPMQGDEPGKENE